MRSWTGDFFQPLCVTSTVATKKKDPFLEALSHDTVTRPRTRAMGRRTRPMTRRMEYPAPRTSSVSFKLEWRQLPLPIQAAILFAALTGLGTLAAPLVASLIMGRRGLEYVIASFATESGVSTALLGGMVPMLAAGFALVIYFNARRKVQHMRQSMSRALLVGLLTWLSFSGWATKLWCLPIHYLSCYSKIVTVTGILAGGPVLLAGLLAGYWVGRTILKEKPKAEAE